jgi:ketosteroid isomerase-like protein
MSEENVEIVRRIFEAVERRDRKTILALYDPQMEARAEPGTLADRIGQRRVLRGHEGLREFDRELRQAFESFETTCEELIDSGSQIFSASRYTARGRGSGIEVEGPLQFGVWTIRDGRVVRVLWFSDRTQALDAAGLPE